MSRKEEANRKIRDLGVLPEEAFEKYTNERYERVRERYCLLLTAQLKKDL